LSKYNYLLDIIFDCQLNYIDIINVIQKKIPYFYRIDNFV